MSTWAIVLAAGRGERFGTAKQFLQIGGVRAVDRVVETVRQVLDGIVLVLPAGSTWDGPAVDVVATGGPTRAASVRAGLAAVPSDVEVVVIHDAAHPLASTKLFEQVVAAVLGGADAAVCVLPMTEVVQVVRRDRVVDVLPKQDQVLAQSPAAFRAEVLRAAHATAPEATEDVGLVVAHGAHVVTVPGEAANLHVTTPEEFRMASLLAGDRGMTGEGP